MIIFVRYLMSLTEAIKHRILPTLLPAGFTFQKPNLKVYLVISIYAISIIIEPDIHCHNLRAKKMGNVILYVTITI